MLSPDDPLILDVAKELNWNAFMGGQISPSDQQAKQKIAMEKAYRLLRVVERKGRLLTAPDTWEVGCSNPD